MPDIGKSDENTFSAEKVIALKPDVFFLAAWMFNALRGADKQIEAAGIPLVVIDYNAPGRWKATRLLRVHSER